MKDTEHPVRHPRVHLPDRASARRSGRSPCDTGSPLRCTATAVQASSNPGIGPLV